MADMSRPVSGGSMNPARTLGPALASGYYKGLWVYFVGPPLGTLLGAWSYNFIRFHETRQVHAVSSAPSISIKLRRMRSDQSNAAPATIGSDEDHLRGSNV